MRFRTDHTTPTGRRPSAAFARVPYASPHRGAGRIPAPTPVCDGCHDPAAEGPWHGGDDGAQYCDDCRAAIRA